jgi:TrwC relaxase
MTAAAPARTVITRSPAVSVKTDVKTGHDIAYLTRGHASGCAGAMAYYTRSGDPPGTWEGRGCAALGVWGTVQAEVAERLYQEGIGPGGERIIQHATPKDGEDQAAAEAAAIAQRTRCVAGSSPSVAERRLMSRILLPAQIAPSWSPRCSASTSVLTPSFTAPPRGILVNAVAPVAAPRIFRRPTGPRELTGRSSCGPDAAT